MKKILIPLILLFLCFPKSVIAADEWTTGDTYREVTAFVLRSIDWKTTLDIARRPQEFSELNPLLGHHPSEGKVNTYFLITSLIHPVISYYLPKDYRIAFQYISIGVSGTAGLTNLWSGLQIKY